MRMKSIAGMMMAGLLSHPSLAGEQLPWSYDGLENGQDMWGELRPDYAKCAIGTAQSPIIIGYTSSGDLIPLTPRYKESPAHINYIDYTIDVAPEPGNILVVDGTGYALKHIQFHSPSEHMVLDVFYPLEIHFMHESADGKALNLALFAEYGEANQAYAPITSNIPGSDNASHTITVNPASLLPSSLGYYAYTGSMSRPPCSEGVEWRILKRPVALSRDQIARLQAKIGRNARLEQPVYTRIIKETTY